MDQSQDEAKDLRACVNNLVSVLALPAIWVGGEPLQIARVLLDVLSDMLRLDFIYVHLNTPASVSPIELVRFARIAPHSLGAQEIGRMLKPRLADEPRLSSWLMSDPAGSGDVSTVALDLGIQGEMGVLVAASQRKDFPRETERVVLGVAANQAAIALQEARLLSEQRQLAQELERTVAQRTSELVAANEKLKREIAERKKADEKLRRSETYLVEAERLSHTGSWAYDVARRVPSFWSAERCRISGLDPAHGPPPIEQERASHPPEDWAKLMETVERAIRDKSDFQADSRLVLPDGSTKHLHIVGHPVLNNFGEVIELVGSTMDVTAAKQGEALLVGENRLLEMVAKGDSLSLILDAVCRLFEELSENTRCSILLLDAEGIRLRHGAAPSLPKAYIDAMDGAAAGLAFGLPGTAADSDESMILSDIATDPLWADCREVALAHDLRGCWSMPLLGSDGRALGMLAIYSRELQRPTARQQNIIDQMAHIASIAIERNRTQSALAESEERFRRMADAIPEVIWITAIEPEKVLYVSPSFEHIWGLPVEELYRNPRLWTETILLEDRGRVTDTFARWISGAQVDYHDIEYRIVQPGGGIRWIHERGVLTLNEQGKPCLASGISTDITERKEAEDALRRSESYLAEAQKLSRSGSFGWNISTGEVFWSEESYRITGYGLETKPTLDLVIQRIHPDDRARVMETLECAAQTGTDLDFEHRLLMPDGTVKFVHILARAFTDAWGSTEFTGMVMDLTERKRAEEALHQAQAELAHVTRIATLGELTASIAHEINQPLAAVVNNAGACLRWLAARNLEEARNSAALVVADGHRAGEIISRIRALIKKAPPQKDWVDINGTILQIIAVIRSEIQKHNVLLRTQLVYDGPPILADRVQLQQVILNLIMNAIEAMSGMSAVSRELTIHSSKLESSAVTILVRDSGPGVDRVTLDRLFDAFYTTKPQGMGMGLAISRSIVEDHGGRLWVTAHEGQGAVFQFTLPIEGTTGS